MAELGERVLIAQLHQLIQQLSPLETGDQEGCRDLEHIVGVFQKFRRRIVHAAETNGLSLVVQGDDHNRMDALPLEVFVLQRVSLLCLLQIGDHDGLSVLKVAVPVGADLQRYILQVILLRMDARRAPFVGVVVAAVFVFLENVGPLAAERLSQML